jgi:hypothetical protein
MIEENELDKLKEILSCYTFNNVYNEHHLDFFDLTNELGQYGDLLILLVRIKTQWSDKPVKQYLFVDHKSAIKIFILDEDYNVIAEF